MSGIARDAADIGFDFGISYFIDTIRAAMQRIGESFSALDGADKSNCCVTIP
jgi:hypothetical protein